MRLILRLLAFVALSVAVILGIGDAIRSVADGTLVLTSLRETLADFWPAGLTMIEQTETGLPDAFATNALNLPATALFAALFLLFYLPSLIRRRRRSI